MRIMIGNNVMGKRANREEVHIYMDADCYLCVSKGYICAGDAGCSW